MGFDVRSEVGQHHVAVAVLHQRRPDIAQRPCIRSGIDAVAQIVHHPRKVGVRFVELPRAVRTGGEAGFHLVSGEAEDEDIVVTDPFPDLDICAVQGADGECAVECELHVAGARRFHAGGGNLLGQVGGGDDFFSQSDPVVGYEDDLNAAIHLAVVVDHLGHAVDQADDELCHVVRGRCFGTEDEASRQHFAGRIGLDQTVKMDDVHDVEELALVFVQTLDLDVVHR